MDDLRSYMHHMTTDHHSRSDIVRRAGVDNDVLTFWLRRELIKPMEAPSGRGKALRFDPYQVKVAKMLTNGRAAGLNLDALSAVAATLQRAIDTFRRGEISPTMVASVIEEIEDGGSFQENLQTMKRRMASHPSASLQELIDRYESDQFEPAVLNAARNYEVSDIDDLWLFAQLVDGEGYLMAYRDEREDSWKVERNPSLDGRALPSPACILLDFSSVTDADKVDDESLNAIEGDGI